MSQQSISLLTLTVVAAAALAADRFVTHAGAYPAAGGLPLGVTRSGAGAAGDLLPVDVMGTAVVEAGAAFGRDVALMVGTAGKAVAHDNVGSKHAIGVGPAGRGCSSLHPFIYVRGKAGTAICLNDINDDTV